MATFALLMTGCQTPGSWMTVEPVRPIAPSPAICAPSLTEPERPAMAAVNQIAAAYILALQGHARAAWAIIEKERQRRCETEAVVERT